MSHNAQYYRKKLKKSSKSTNQASIDVIFKQAALRQVPTASTSSQASTSSRVESETDSVSESDTRTGSVLVDPSPDPAPPETRSNPPPESDSEPEENDPSDSVPVPDQRLFTSKKYEARYDWLYYSAAKGGYCCKICDLFQSTSENAFVEGTMLGDHPSRKLECHQNGKCHKASLTRFHSSKCMSKPKKSVLDMMVENVHAKKQAEVEINRNYVVCLVKLCYFIVTQHWALNAFEPMLDFITDLEPPAIKEFMATVVTRQSSVKYASSTTVSDILACINIVLEEELLVKLRKAPYYALLADESSDEAHKEQFALLVRFPSEGSVADHFLGIIHVKRTDAASLMEAIEAYLHSKEVDTKKAYFVGFDGCNTMSGERTGLQRRFRHHMPYQIYIHCRNHRLALCIKHLMQSFPVLQDIDSLLLSVWKLFHYSPQKYAIFMDVQAAYYGLKNLKIIRAAATRWLSHGQACRRLIDRYVQVLDALDLIIDRKRDPEVEGVRNMLCSKTNVAGILILCDLLKPVIAFSDYLQGSTIDFTVVNQRLKDLTAELHALTDRFQNSIMQPDLANDDLYFSKLTTLYEEIDDRTAFQRRLREQGVHDPQQIVAEIATPITHRLIHELEDSFHCTPVLEAFSLFNLETVPDSICELKDYKKDSIQALAAHYGRVRVDMFKGDRVEANPTHTEDNIKLEFEQFKRQMFIFKQRGQPVDVFEELSADEPLRNAFPVMYFLSGLGRIIPTSTASVERLFSLMNNLCTASRSRLGQASLDSLMRVCSHNQRHGPLTMEKNPAVH